MALQPAGSHCMPPPSLPMWMPGRGSFDLPSDPISRPPAPHPARNGPAANGQPTSPSPSSSSSFSLASSEETDGEGAGPGPVAVRGVSVLVKCMIAAAERGDLEQVKSCLAVGARIDAQDSHGNTALHVATSNNRARVVEYLLNAGDDANARDHRGATPLHLAVASDPSGHLVRMLLDAGARPDIADDQGRTPLDLAAGGGDHVTLELLQNAEPDPCGGPLKRRGF
ncbi:E3 ubiquitin-protein ligase mind-bomb [Gryllus bimaculatus]|nr:E3 ubiquitin-protein ligase mind-bomb [Gryllus bimaculatus]